MVYGYIRVSTREQNEDRQLIAIQEKNIQKSQIYMDKMSGKDFNRPAYKRLLKKLKKGDLIVVKSIDRLGRNYEEIIEQWRIITKEKGADILVIDMPLLDTTRGKDLLGTFISDLVLQLLSFVAENERNNIRQRQMEGIQAAKQKGIQFGRPKIQTPVEFKYIVDDWKKGKFTRKEAIKLSGLKESTFYNRIREFNLK